MSRSRETQLTRGHPDQISGTVAPGFETVRDAFASNFEKRGEVGAAFAAYVDGELVVDLWGGWSDAGQRRRWNRNSLQLIFSGTKALAATAILVMLDRGVLGLGDPVVRYWPEFGAHEKEAITVAHVLSHSAGLPFIEEQVRAEDLCDGRGMARRVAAQRALWPAGSRVAYHALTYGWILGELIWRVSGVSIGDLFEQAVARPLELEAWIGLPAAEEERVTTISMHPGFEAAMQRGMEHAGFRRVYDNPPRFLDPGVWNRSAYHAAEIPGVNGIATARSMARLFGCLACGGRLGDTRLVRDAAVTEGIGEISRGTDPLTGEWLAYAAGFMLQTPYAFLGPTAEGFGHGGAGGSIHGAWRSKRTGFSYVMNEMREEIGDDRSRVLIAALYAAVA